MVNSEDDELTVSIRGKRKRRRLRVDDPDFVPPDGGWGWLIVLACGFSNLSTFPMFQQFGLVFRDKFQRLEITESETTTITNLTAAFNACVGLANGPIFRYFTFRQASMFGSVLVTLSLLACIFCSSFWSYLLCYSIFYGIAFGMVQSSVYLALNTYFKEKRRVATGFSWTTTALGPIIWPYIIVGLNELYGMEGTLLLFGGFAMHSFACALLLQPVEWHTKFREELDTEPVLDNRNSHIDNAPGKLSKFSSRIFSSQYLCDGDGLLRASFDIIGPGTPMMVKSNDGWYSRNMSQIGSRISLASSRENKQTSRIYSRAVSKITSAINLNDYGKESLNTNYLLPYPNESYVLKSAAKKLQQYEQQQELEEQEEVAYVTELNVDDLSIWKKVSIFFDFELLKDLVFVNIMMGITIANFAEINFSIMTPIIMTEFNFSKLQIATFMSLLGVTDIVVRFITPFVADNIGWSNKTFFLIGVMSMAMARILLIHTQTYYVALLVAVIIGAGKALRTIFMALIIPSHVPIERLPAASGLHLAFSGFFFILSGPLVGWIRQMVGNYVITLHLLNFCTYVTAASWITEAIIKTNREKKNLNSNLK